MTSLTWRSALAWRMDRHGLVTRPFSDAADVARALCGLHAQVASSASLSAFVRGASSPSPDGLVKTWAVRGTLHLLPLDELGLWHSAFATYAHFLKGSWLRGFGFASREELEALIDRVGAALVEGPKTREELASAIPEHADKLRDGFGTCLKPAAFRGLLVFDEPRGRNVVFRAPPAADRPPVDEAVKAVTRKYLAAYGPARREDLSRWWGSPALSPAKAQRRFEALGDEVCEVDVEGSRCWVLRADVDAMRSAEPPRVSRLLPLFDQYVVNANRGVEALLPAAFADRVYRTAGWISPCVLVDGAIAGVWRHERKGPHLVVDVEPFGRLATWAASQIAEDAERLAEHLGGTLDLRLHRASDT